MKKAIKQVPKLKDKRNQPKLKLNQQRSDLIVEVVAGIALLILIGIPIYYFSVVPDNVPSHFNLFGQADSYKQKGIIWLLPILGTILYLALTVLQRIPHHFNYIIEITEANAERQYRLSIRLLQILKTIVTAVMAFVLYASIQTAFGNWNGLGNYFIPVFMVLIFAVIIVFLLKSYRIK